MPAWHAAAPYPRALARETAGHAAAGAGAAPRRAGDPGAGPGDRGARCASTRAAPGTRARARATCSASRRTCAASRCRPARSHLFRLPAATPGWWKAAAAAPPSPAACAARAWKRCARRGVAGRRQSPSAHGRALGRARPRAARGAARRRRGSAPGRCGPGTRSLYRDGAFAIGNAAGEAHPIVGEGIAMAMRSAALLCGPLSAALKSTCSPRVGCPRLHARLVARFRLALAGIAAFSRSLAMQPRGSGGFPRERSRPVDRGRRHQRQGIEFASVGMERNRMKLFRIVLISRCVGARRACSPPDRRARVDAARHQPGRQPAGRTARSRAARSCRASAPAFPARRSARSSPAPCARTA